MGRFNDELEALYAGEDIVSDDILSSFAVDLLEGRLLQSDPEVLESLNEVITISNILYNNTDRVILPLDDGIYDMLMVLASKLLPNYQVGNIDVVMPITSQPKLKKPFIKVDELKQPFVKVDDDTKIQNGIYTEALLMEPAYTANQFLKHPFINMEQCKKKVMNIPHEYPKLVGTLDKVKFVLDSQADDKGVLNDDNVAVFERDFLRKHMEMGLFGPHDNIRMLATLKMDGVSVEATVSDRLISARSRGDTNNDIATDLTPALKGYKFPKAEGIVTDDKAFGMKFECMLSTNALTKLGIERNVDYANPRNAIIGLLGAGDCNQWIDYITLIPLETSLDVDPLEEVIFMNALYAMEPLRYVVLEGTYNEILFQVKKFVEEAEYVRPIMPYIYDGVVLTYLDKDIRESLGRVNSVNKYQIAIKFNPIKKFTVFTGYTYSIGQNGVVTPLAHYKPIELFGATHSKTSAHSKARFEELALRKGDIVSIELINDVIPYITKADIYENTINGNPLEEFPSKCPECGTDLIVSDSGKSVVCPNKNCPGRRLSITTNMLSKLGFKDFSEETLKDLPHIRSLTDLVYIDPNDLDILGPINKENFLARIRELLSSNMWDYRLIGALGFSNISDARWAVILRRIPLYNIITLSDDDLDYALRNIKGEGIGKSIRQTIVEERHLLMEDLLTISEYIPHRESYGTTGNSTQIRFSGVRDGRLMEYLQNLGYDCTDGGVTSKTKILIIPYQGYTSTKTAKVPEDCQIITLDNFISNLQDYPEEV